MALTFVVFITPAAAESRNTPVDLCQYRPSADETSRNHRAGLIIPDEPFTEPCPPGYRPVHRSNGALY